MLKPVFNIQGPTLRDAELDEFMGLFSEARKRFSEERIAAACGVRVTQIGLWRRGTCKPRSTRLKEMIPAIRGLLSVGDATEHPSRSAAHLSVTEVLDALHDLEAEIRNDPRRGHDTLNNILDGALVGVEMARERVYRLVTAGLLPSRTH